MQLDEIRATWVAWQRRRPADGTSLESLASYERWLNEEPFVAHDHFVCWGKLLVQIERERANGIVEVRVTYGPSPGRFYDVRRTVDLVRADLAWVAYMGEKPDRLTAEPFVATRRAHEAHEAPVDVAADR